MPSYFFYLLENGENRGRMTLREAPSASFDGEPPLLNTSTTKYQNHGRGQTVINDIAFVNTALVYLRVNRSFLKWRLWKVLDKMLRG